MERKNLQNFLWLMLLSVSFYSARSQSASDAKNFIPNITRTAPETEMVKRFGNYKVNLFNGLPNISIPLYEINTGKISVPIALSYHAAGVRVRDEATWVGLGWNLSAGGSISRMVKGRPDEFAGYLNQTYQIRDMNTLDPLHNTDDLNYLQNVTRGVIDCDPDIYTFNLPTISNKFYYKNAKIDSPIYIPFAPLKLISTINNNRLLFNVKDEKGIEYVLNTDFESSYPGSAGYSSVSSWQLSKMISNDKTDTISFTYNSNDYQSPGGDYYDMVTITDKIINDVSGACGAASNNNSSSSPVYTSGGGQSTNIGSNVPKEIFFPEGKVVFELSSSARTDLGNKNLNAVKVYRRDPVNGTYFLIKLVKFYYGYFVNGASYRMRLDSIQILDKQSITPQTYSFSYNQSIAMPALSHRGRDYWGFYNGQSSTQNLIPNQVVLLGDGPASATIGGPVNGREPDPNYNQVGVLQKVNFPTGGYSEFIYETNKYWDDQTSTVKLGGGLRIKQIKDFDPISGNTNLKTYAYKVSDRNGPADTGFGYIVLPIRLSYFNTEQWNYYAFNYQIPQWRFRTWNSNPNIGLDTWDGTIVGYTEVREYLGTPASNSGYTTYKYSWAQDQANSWVATGISRPNILSRAFQRGLLLEQSTYKNVGANLQIVEKQVNSYGNFPDENIGAKTLVVFERNVYLQPKTVNCYSQSASQIEPYLYNTYSILTGDNRIKSSEMTKVDDNDPSKLFVTTTNYFYDNFSHLQVSRTETVNSRGENYRTTLKYPGDFTGNATLTAMVNANIVNAVVDKQVSDVTNSASPIDLSFVHTEYSQPYTSKFYPSYISTRIKNNSTYTEVTFNSYDNQGNILQYTGKDGVVTSFIWDYGLVYPIAKVSGAAQSEIAYTSFESNGSGNWSLAGYRLLDPTAPTGKYAFNITGNLTRSSLPAKSFIVSYWKKSGTVSVTNSTSVITGRSIGSWTYYQHLVSLATAGSVTVSGAGAIIDELRIYPVGGQMTTFTFEPLVGMTSQCDAINRTMYYEYDGFNRLILVRDQDRNIVKEMCYNYAGQPVNCSIVYNGQQTQSFTKTCGSGYFGSIVSYVVPTGTYQSVDLGNANQLALNDIAAYGQDFANTTGTCTAGVAVQSYNSKSVPYNLRFTNNSTGITYAFTLSPNTTQFSTVGLLPNGTYSVTFYPQSTGLSSTFVVGGTSASGYTTYTFYNINVSGTSISAYMY